MAKDKVKVLCHIVTDRQCHRQTEQIVDVPEFDAREGGITLNFDYDMEVPIAYIHSVALNLFNHFEYRLAINV